MTNKKLVLAKHHLKIGLALVGFTLALPATLLSSSMIPALIGVCGILVSGMVIGYQASRTGIAVANDKNLEVAQRLAEQRNTLLLALEELLEHEGTVDFTGIGEFPSEALGNARQQAREAINAVKSNTPKNEAVRVFCNE